MLTVYFKRTKGGVKIPHREHDTDAGWDLYAPEDAVIYPSSTIKIDTGVSVQAEFDDPADAKKFIIMAKVEGTSGNAAKLSLSPIGGVVDQGYTGVIGVVLANLGSDPVKIEKGKKIAQLVFNVLPKISCTKYLGVADEFAETDRGSAGFGSTGTAS